MIEKLFEVIISKQLLNHKFKIVSHVQAFTLTYILLYISELLDQYMESPWNRRKKTGSRPQAWSHNFAYSIITQLHT